MVLLSLLGVIIGYVFYDDVKDWVITEVRDYLSHMEYGELKMGEMDISLFHPFPGMTVQINEIQFYEKKDSLNVLNETPILYFKQLNLTFDAWELIRNKNLIVTSLRINDGILDIVSFDDNTTNLERAFSKPKKVKEHAVPSDSLAIKTTSPKVKTSNSHIKKPDKGQQLLSINLKEIRLKNITLNYNNPSEQYATQTEIAELYGKLLLNKQGISSNLQTSFKIVKSTKLPTIAEQGPMSLKLNMDFIEASQLITIKKGDLSFKNLHAGISGSFDYKNQHYIDMSFDASSNNISFLSKLLKEDILKENKSLVEKAKMILKGTIKGKLKNNMPKLDVNFGVKDLSIAIPFRKDKFSNIGFEGEFHSGEKADFSGAQLSIRNIRGKTPGGSITGNAYISDFKNPYLKSNIKLSLNLEGFDDVFDLPKIDALKGRIHFDSEIDGRLNLKNQNEPVSIGSWSFKMEDIGFKYIPTEKVISKLNGTLNASENNVVINNFSMDYAGSDLNINGHIENLYHFIFQKEQDIVSDFEIRSHQIFTDHFIQRPNAKAVISDRISNLHLNTHITMRDYDLNDPYFYKINTTITHLSFDLDALPSISNIKGNCDFYKSEKGLIFNLHEFQGILPFGELNINGNVFFPPDFKTLELNADLKLKEVPQEYVLELINDLKGQKFLGTKQLKREEITFLNGNLMVSGNMELVPFALEKARIKNSNISFNPPNSGSYNLQNVNIDVSDLYFLHEKGSKKIVGVKSATGEIHIDTVNTSIIKNLPVDVILTGASDLFKIEFKTLRGITGIDKGKMLLDISKDLPVFDLEYNIKEAPIKSVLKNFTTEQLMDGNFSTSLKIKGEGKKLDEITRSLKGHIMVTGESFELYGIDLDNLLKKYERSQKFNLTDISAFMIAGPIGTLVTKGADFTSLISAHLEPEHRTHVSKAMASWKIEKGIIETQDVAFSTKVNRLAFKGAFNFINESIPGFTVYVVDKNGCSLMEQTIQGNIGEIEIGKLKIAKTFLGSVINLVNSVVGSDCEPVYTGVIEHPIPAD